MPVYNLASKILCRVINVSLKAEPDTDEVFAQVTLLPESNVSGFLWLELQSTSFVADQKLPYLDFAAQCRHLNSITTNPIQGEGCRTLWNCRKCRSPTRNWRCHHPSILGSFRPLELAGSGEQSVSVLECTGIKEANSRFVFVCPAVVSKLEEALWINNRKYDALWCWEMLKLLVHFALRTRMRQGFQKVLQCFLKAFNEFVQRRVSHYKELNPTENLLLLKAFCELQAQDRNRLKSNFCGLVLLLGSLPWRLNYQNLVFPHCRFQVVVAERIKLKEKKIKYTNELESKV
ncbi:uncharacterized protein LOC125471864 isoform X4 [Pyrus x bretschneideri]|uniref:uncharacterized protein LOC125471864 isoform X4 n=1 Tax=Pyrus x bretschneideri TaxID=225117 RepID=UPI00202E7391|nr:uncharacterized protein LOC125471864 isoform X4 [Pyrus x bretschneideri]